MDTDALINLAMAEINKTKANDTNQIHDSVCLMRAQAYLMQAMVEELKNIRLSQ